MLLDENTQAILLLSTHFSVAKAGDPKPLTAAEYGKLSLWLREHRFQPGDFLSRFSELKAAWKPLSEQLSLNRIEYLLGRGVAMGLALEKWSTANIWIISRADREYPFRLKQKIGNQAPPILFGVGNKQLLSKGGLAIVGSRDVGFEDESYARLLAEGAAKEGLNVVSGGARGVDEVAMLAALEAHGTAVGVLAAGLLSAALSGKWKRYLRSFDLCLLSSSHPEASFHVGSAMGRNKYIYCLSDYCAVVRSEEGRGGTWSGAVEALKKNLSPVFVKPESDARGNGALLNLGASPLPSRLGEMLDDPNWLRGVLAGERTAPPEGVERTRLPLTETIRQGDSDVRHEQILESVANEVAPALETSHSGGSGASELFFDYFLAQLERHLKTDRKISLKTLKGRHPDLTPKQLTAWLERALDEGIIERPGKAHLYVLSKVSGENKVSGSEGQVIRERVGCDGFQPSLFSEP